MENQNEIWFYDTKDKPYGVFSNFYPCKLKYNDIIYNNSEGYYQAEKFKGPDSTKKELEYSVIIKSRKSNKTSNEQKTEIIKICNINIKSNETDVYLPIMDWVKLKPCLNELVKLTIADDSCEERTIRFKRLGSDSTEYFEWKKSIREGIKAPISIGSGNEGAEGERINKVYESYNSFIRITNRIKINREARESFAYKFYGGRPDKGQITPAFYDAMVNAGFTKDDFAIGKFGYQDLIYIKSVSIKNKEVEKGAQELKEFIIATLERIEQPYAAFIIDIDKDVPYSSEELGHYGGRNSFFHEQGYEPLSKIYMADKNRIYVVYSNDKRQILNLHKLSYNDAKEKVEDYILEKYENFENKCSIITGQGIHSANNFSIIRNDFPKWLKGPELKHCVENCILDNTGGCYKVKLVKSMEITLSGIDFEVDVDKVIYFISKGEKIGDFRLKITHLQNQSADYVAKVIMHATCLRYHPINKSVYPSNFPNSFEIGKKDNAHLLTWENIEDLDESENFDF